ncbi:hypothetical protein NJ7G_3228 [Natrinema sp. J7-2]|nr:hypothetical protein NJ7G_3228 [Natrinema sp. J7-2]
MYHRNRADVRSSAHHWFVASNEVIVDRRLDRRRRAHSFAMECVEGTDNLGENGVLIS